MKRPKPSREFKVSLAAIGILAAMWAAGTRSEIVYFDVMAPDLSGRRLAIDRRHKLNPPYVRIGDRLFLRAGSQVSFLNWFRFQPDSVECYQWELDQVFGDRNDLLAMMPDHSRPMYGIKWLREKDL